MSYPASKAGGEGLIRGLAKELGPKGVNVNAIAPRLIDTGEMMRVNYPTQADLDAVLKKYPSVVWGLSMMWLTWQYFWQIKITLIFRDKPF